jgi:gamma-glutamylcyclotransferase (GGCT)/AIG2-like uncharacterized protein YtfP
MEYLFVYGTLQEPEVQQRIIGRVVPGAPDILDGFGRSKLAMGDGVFPLVIPRHGSSVDGLLLEVTPDELARLDYYETSAYRRFWVTLRSGRECWVYG